MYDGYLRRDRAEGKSSWMLLSSGGRSNRSRRLLSPLQRGLRGAGEVDLPKSAIGEGLAQAVVVSARRLPPTASLQDEGQFEPLVPNPRPPRSARASPARPPGASSRLRPDVDAVDASDAVGVAVDHQTLQVRVHPCTNTGFLVFGPDAMPAMSTTLNVPLHCLAVRFHPLSPILGGDPPAAVVQVRGVQLVDPVHEPHAPLAGCDRLVVERAAIAAERGRSAPPATGPGPRSNSAGRPALARIVAKLPTQPRHLRRQPPDLRVEILHLRLEGRAVVLGRVHGDQSTTFLHFNPAPHTVRVPGPTRIGAILNGRRLMAPSTGKAIRSHRNGNQNEHLVQNIATVT